MRSLLFLSAICCFAPVTTWGVDLLDFADDDYGAGELLYPNRNDCQPGDLDLLAFRAENKNDGTWFTATFHNPIRLPGQLMTEIGQVPISRLARHDFYTFNVDVYIDQDLESGSGSTEGLPGRKVAIDPATAWEKTILLTPRPAVARSLLIAHLERIEERAFRAEYGRVKSDDSKRINANVDEQVDEEYFFPDRIRVQGREIRFFVPADFLGGAASDDWAYTVLVTGAELEQTTLFGTTPENFRLMNMPVERGMSFEAFGLPAHADPEQPPVVDYLNHDGSWQEVRLGDYNLAENRYASMVGVVPSGRKTDAVLRPVVQEPPPAAGQASLPTAAREPAGPQAEPPPLPSGKSLADRLRAIRTLRDQGVITEDEYQSIRRRLVEDY